MKSTCSNVKFSIARNGMNIVTKMPRDSAGGFFKRFLRYWYDGSLTFSNEQSILQYLNRNFVSDTWFPKIVSIAPMKETVLEMIDCTDSVVFKNGSINSEYIFELVSAFTSLRNTKLIVKQPLPLRIIQSGAYKVYANIKAISSHHISLLLKLHILFKYIIIELRSALYYRQMTIFLSHNDFFPNNILISNAGVTIIDWEDASYSKTNPFFDIVDICFNPNDLEFNTLLFEKLSAVDPNVPILSDRAYSNMLRMAFIKSTLRALRSNKFSNKKNLLCYLKQELLNSSKWAIKLSQIQNNKEYK